MLGDLLSNAAGDARSLTLPQFTTRARSRSKKPRWRPPTRRELFWLLWDIVWALGNVDAFANGGWVPNLLAAVALATSALCRIRKLDTECSAQKLRDLTLVADLAFVGAITALIVSFI